MEEIKNIYQNLSGVNVNDQFGISDGRAKGYVGEFAVLSEVLQKIEGQFKILMNLNVPIDGKTTEIDLLMIHETGIYVFEVKNYKGTIYGDMDGKRWTQYFRTVKNNTFLNPVLQNEYHIRALHKLGMNQPMYSAIVFTNQACQLKINDHGFGHQEDVMMVDELANVLNRGIKNRKSCLPLEEIDRLFNLLKTFTVIQEPVEVYETQEKMSVHDLMQRLQKEVQDQKLSLKKLKRQYRFKVLGVILICLMMIGAVGQKINPEVQSQLEEVNRKLVLSQENLVATEQELGKLRQKFQVVSDDEVKIINLPLDIVVDQLELVPHDLYEGACQLSFEVKNQSDYSLKLNSDAVLLVMLTDGTLQEYPIFGEHNFYHYASAAMIKNQPKFFGLFDLMNIASEIQWIKLSSLEVSRTVNYQTEVVEDAYEVMIYED